MTPQQIVALLLRCFCAWLLLVAVQIAALTLLMASSPSRATQPNLIMAGLYAVAAFAGWFGADSISRCFLGRSPSAPAARLDARSAGTVICAAMGLALIAFKGLAPVASYAALIWILSATGQQQALHAPGNHIDGVNGIAMCGLGVALVASAKPFGRWLSS